MWTQRWRSFKKMASAWADHNARLAAAQHGYDPDKMVTPLRTFPPCRWCGAKYEPGAIGTVHDRACPIVGAKLRCRRCQQIVEPEDAKPHRAVGSDAILDFIYDLHATPEHCMVALKAAGR